MANVFGLEQGLALAGRYRLLARIGAGGMGEVWRGVDLRLRRPVAIKILPAGLAAEQAAVARFRREAETTARLQHPGITVLFDIDEHPHGRGTLVFLVMELLSGRDLRAVLAGRPTGLPVEQAASLTAQIADALAAAHSSGVVHRDIKPANLFLQDGGRVKICDFGIARLADVTSQLTADGGVLGTPAYMAPEQFRSAPLDGRSDLYALGCVLYEMLLGSPPFRADTAAGIMYRHLNEPPPPPRSRRPEIAEHLDRLTTDLLAKDPAGRPPSAAAVVAFLRASGTGTNEPVHLLPTATLPDQPYEPTAHPLTVVAQPRRRRGRRLATALAALAAATATAIGSVIYLNNPEDHDNPPPKATASQPLSNPDPVVPGWQTMLAPGYGVAYDVPPNWKLEQPGTFLGFEDSKGNPLAGSLAAARNRRGSCTLAQTGLRGGANPAPNPSADEMAALSGAAAEEARKWALAAYGGSGSPPQPPAVQPRTNNTLQVHGINAAHVIVDVTPTEQGKPCTPRRAVVETLAMAATAKNASTVGPLIFVVLADRTTDQAILQEIVGSLRPFNCPPGTRTHGDNKCSPPSPTPST